MRLLVAAMPSSSEENSLNPCLKFGVHFRYRYHGRDLGAGQLLAAGPGLFAQPLELLTRDGHVVRDTTISYSRQTVNAFTVFNSRLAV